MDFAQRQVCLFVYKNKEKRGKEKRREEKRRKEGRRDEREEGKWETMVL